MKSWCCTLNGGGEAALADIGHGHAAPPEDGFVWCHLNGRIEDERRWLAAESGLPPSVVSALTAVETRPRCDVIGTGALVNLRGLGSTPEDDADPLVSIRLWAEKNRVISVSYRSMAATDAIRAEMEAGRVRDPGDLIAGLAVAITEELDPVIAKLGDDIDDCEADLDPDKAFAMRRLIARVRSEAISYRRFVVPERQALEKLALLDAGWLEDDDRLHLSSAADRFARMAEELEAVRERSALLHEQLTDLRAEQIDTRTLLISMVALVFLPLTFLTGLFGTNYPLPDQDDPAGFWWITAASVVIALAVTGYFVRKHWFRG